MCPEHVKNARRLEWEKRALRTEAEKKVEIADRKYTEGDFSAAKMVLIDARTLIQKALKLVRDLGERGISERSIQDNIEDLMSKITLKETLKEKIQSNF